MLCHAIARPSTLAWAWIFGWTLTPGCFTVPEKSIHKCQFVIQLMLCDNLPFWTWAAFWAQLVFLTLNVFRIFGGYRTCSCWLPALFEPKSTIKTDDKSDDVKNTIFAYNGVSHYRTMISCLVLSIIIFNFTYADSSDSFFSFSGSNSNFRLPREWTGST